MGSPFGGLDSGACEGEVILPPAPTGRIVRDPPADHFGRVLTLDESHSLVSMDTIS